jgi:hypothetical protein
MIANCFNLIHNFIFVHRKPWKTCQAEDERHYKGGKNNKQNEKEKRTFE